MNKKAISFTGKQRFLSNFWLCKIEFNGITYPSVEHAYQAQKTDDKEIQLKISQIHTPFEVKKFGKTIELKDNWDNIKLDVMYDLVNLKFSNNEILKNLLIKTGDTELVERNTWGDSFWGIFENQGQNHLGKILMRVRKELKEKEANDEK